MFIKKLLFALISPNMIYKNNVLNTLTSEIDIHKNKHLGYDERYVNYYTNVTSSKFLKRETDDIEKIGRYMDILKKINKLENANIHDENVETILRHEIGLKDIYAYSIKAGGLLSDW